MAPDKKPKKDDSKKFKKMKNKNKKKKKSKTVSTVPIDNRAIDSEWWDVFWHKNSTTLGDPFPSLLRFFCVYFSNYFFMEI